MTTNTNMQALPLATGDERNTTLLTVAKLAEITVRVQHADQGPWMYDDHPDGRSYGYIRQGERRPAPWPAIAQATRTAGMHTSDNGQFLAHAREDIPALLSEIALLRHYVLTYGAHSEHCAAQLPFGVEQCTCGFGAVLAQLHT